MIIDTHCHISKDDDYKEIIEDNFNNDVEIMVVSFCDIEKYDFALSLTKLYKGVYLTLGYHPEYSKLVSDKDIKYLVDTIKNNDKIVGIGEIGLDYYYEGYDRKSQLDLFERQLKIAEELNMPVVIHSRNAEIDTINTLKKYKVKGVIHCFSGDIDIALEYIELGFYLGIGGIVTFKNSNLFKVIEVIGLDNIVFETDSPYLAPVPVRGKKNSSKNIKYVALRVAEILDIDYKEVIKKVYENSCILFDL